jgi:integrase
VGRRVERDDASKFRQVLPERRVPAEFPSFQTAFRINAKGSNLNNIRFRYYFDAATLRLHLAERMIFTFPVFVNADNYAVSDVLFDRQINIRIIVNHIRNRLFITLHTGLRRNEIFSLKWFDVDFNRHAIQIRESKSGKSRSVPMNATVKTLLSGLKRTSEYLFPSPKTGEKLTDIKEVFDGH